MDDQHDQRNPVDVLHGILPRPGGGAVLGRVRQRLIKRGTPAGVQGGRPPCRYQSPPSAAGEMLHRWTPSSMTSRWPRSLISTRTCTAILSCRSPSTAPPERSPRGLTRSRIRGHDGHRRHRRGRHPRATAPARPHCSAPTWTRFPVQEQTGLPYASTARGIDPDGEDVPVMHACGHDMHVTCLIGAATLLAADPRRLVGHAHDRLPAGRGARGRRPGDDRRRPVRPVRPPDVVLGQHVAPAPGRLPGPASGPGLRRRRQHARSTCTAAAGTAPAPEASVDPVVMAAVHRHAAADHRVARGRRHRHRRASPSASCARERRRTSSPTRRELRLSHPDLRVQACAPGCSTPSPASSRARPPPPAPRVRRPSR